MCNSKLASILFPKSSDTYVDVVLAGTSETIPALENAAKTQVDLRVDRQIRPEPRNVGIVRVVTNETELLYFKLAPPLARQEHLIPAKGIMGARANIPFHIIVENHASDTVHKPKHIVLCSSSNSIVNIIERTQIEEERLHTVAVVKAFLETSVCVDKRTYSSSYCEDWRNIIDKTPSYTTYRIKFIDMIEQFQELLHGTLERLIQPCTE